MFSTKNCYKTSAFLLLCIGLTNSPPDSVVCRGAVRFNLQAVQSRSFSLFYTHNTISHRVSPFLWDCGSNAVGKPFPFLFAVLPANKPAPCP